LLYAAEQRHLAKSMAERARSSTTVTTFSLTPADTSLLAVAVVSG
jgi:hypothetical protein